MTSMRDRGDTQSPWWPLATLALVVACLALAAGVFAGEGEPAGDQEIRVQRIVTECAGDDCPEAHAHAQAIFVGEDGEVHEIDFGGGGDLEWVSEDGSHRIVQRLHPEGPSGYLGVMLNPLTPELRAHLGVPDDAGVQVSKVVDDSPAWRAGLRVGDVISAVDGEAVASPRDLAMAVRGRGDGDAVSLEVWRDGAVQTITSGVAEREIVDHPMHVIRHEMAGGEPHERRIEIRCEGEECEGVEGEWEFDPESIDCGGAEECEVRVECTGAGCDCTVNGDSVDCATIPGPHNG